MENILDKQLLCVNFSDVIDVIAHIDKLDNVSGILVVSL